MFPGRESPEPRHIRSNRNGPLIVPEISKDMSMSLDDGYQQMLEIRFLD